MNSLNKKFGKGFCFSALIFLFVIIASCIALYPRVEIERVNDKVGITVDYRDVVMLAQNSKRTPEDVLKYLVSCGVTGIMVSEITGEDMLAGGLPVFYGTAEGSEYTRLSGEKGSLMIIPPNLAYAQELAELLLLRFGGKRLDTPQGIVVILPFTMGHMEKFGVAPDLEGLYAAKKLNLPVFWRVAQALNGETQNALEMLSNILGKFDNIKIAAAVGDVALGFPDMSKLAGVLKKYNIPAAQLEFSRQLGAPQLNNLLFPNLISLHSVTQEEMTSRNISRLALYERLIRAASERAVRLLMFRPAQSGTSADPIGEFGAEISELKNGLLARGLKVEMPDNVFSANKGSGWKVSLFGFAACSAMFVYALFRYYFRYSGSEPKGLSACIAFILCSAAVFAAAKYSQRAADLLGAFTSVFVVVEASLTAMDSWKSPVVAALKGFIVAVVGGLAIASLFCDPSYMMRIKAFSGVKLTLMLPPVFVLLYDMHRRIHPESLRDMLSRPPLWGELVLAFVLLAGAGIILFRSDNVKVVPGFEAQLREFLERTLIARPRNKEILLGFPCLFLYSYVMAKGMWVHYREALRIGVVIGFSSVVNSFCHFHTPLYFILIRQVNGLWVGMLAGLVAVTVFHFIIRPAYSRFQSVID